MNYLMDLELLQYSPNGPAAAGNGSFLFFNPYILNQALSKNNHCLYRAGHMSLEAAFFQSV